MVTVLITWMFPRPEPLTESPPHVSSKLTSSLRSSNGSAQSRLESPCAELYLPRLLALRAIMAAEVRTTIAATKSVFFAQSVVLPHLLARLHGQAACGAIENREAEEELDEATARILPTLRTFPDNVFLDVAVKFAWTPASFATNIEIFAAVSVSTGPF